MCAIYVAYMPSAKHGDRVGAILSANEEQVKLLGYGTYDGIMETPRPLGFFASLLPDEAAESWEACIAHYKEDVHPDAELEQLPRHNPRITLDSGVVIWGAECWWGPEEVVKKKIEKLGAPVIEVDPRTVEGLQAYDPAFVAQEK